MHATIHTLPAPRAANTPDRERITRTAAALTYYGFLPEDARWLTPDPARAAALSRAMKAAETALMADTLIAHLP